CLPRNPPFWPLSATYVADSGQKERFLEGPSLAKNSFLLTTDNRRRTFLMDPLLRCINLTKSFGALPVLRQISFEVVPGEVVGLAGRSGAGKAVLAALLAGIERPTEGDLYLNGHRLRW